MKTYDGKYRVVKHTRQGGDAYFTIEYLFMLFWAFPIWMTYMWYEGGIDCGSDEIAEFSSEENAIAEIQDIINREKKKKNETVIKSEAI